MSSKSPKSQLSKKQISETLSNWVACNEFLKTCSEEDAIALLAAEQQGKRRVQYLMRVHSKMNKERARRERSELLA